MHDEQVFVMSPASYHVLMNCQGATSGNHEKFYTNLNTMKLVAVEGMPDNKIVLLPWKLVDGLEILLDKGYVLDCAILILRELNEAHDFDRLEEIDIDLDDF